MYLTILEVVIMQCHHLKLWDKKNACFPSFSLLTKTHNGSVCLLLCVITSKKMDISWWGKEINGIGKNIFSRGKNPKATLLTPTIPTIRSWDFFLQCYLRKNSTAVVLNRKYIWKQYCTDMVTAKVYFCMRFRRILSA